VYVKTIASQTWDVFETQCSSWPIRARIASYLVFQSSLSFFATKRTFSVVTSNFHLWPWC